MSQNALLRLFIDRTHTHGHQPPDWSYCPAQARIFQVVPVINLQLASASSPLCKPNQLCGMRVMEV